MEVYFLVNLLKLAIPLARDDIARQSSTITQEKGPHYCEAPSFLGICLCFKLLSSDYASHLTNLV